MLEGLLFNSRLQYPIFDIPLNSLPFMWNHMHVYHYSVKQQTVTFNCKPIFVEYATCSSGALKCKHKCLFCGHLVTALQKGWFLEEMTIETKRFFLYSNIVCLFIKDNDIGGIG